MKKKKIMLMLALAVLLFAGCKKEELVDFQVLAVSESTEGVPGAKTRLVNESFVYWETGDTISLRHLDREAVPAVFQKSYGNNDSVKAVFLPVENQKVPRSGKFIALFPYNVNNILEEENVKVVMPSEQGYRGDGSADFSFGRKACPMVAYGGFKDETDDLVRMLFHNLCGLVRLQVLNDREVGQDRWVTKITISSEEGGRQQLSGQFAVKGYDQNAPWLDSTSAAAKDKSITITPAEPVKIPAEGGLTFYIALPARHATGTTTYKDLDLTITAEGDGKTYTAQKRFSTGVRRNGITYMPALTVTGWAIGSGSGDATTGITGHGTQERPFLIYSANDLIQLRDACNGSGSLNGIRLNSTDVIVRIMRSDIILDKKNWTKGFDNFKCTMVYGATQANPRPGITNNSQSPIFHKLSGVVRGITVRGKLSETYNEDDTANFSPLCHTNNGRIENCMVGDTSTFCIAGAPATKAIAGLCVYNSGTIADCGCRGKLAAGRVAGICYRNNGTIERCYASSPMQGAVGTNHSQQAAGICYDNRGTVQDCYMAANINKANTRWGGIVYLNSGTVKNSYLDASGIIQSRTAVGGIVNTMTDGLVDGCWVNTDLIDVDAGGLGGVVHTLSGGEIRNSSNGRGDGSLSCRGGALGGFVAYMNGGSIVNCYSYCDLTQSTVTMKGLFAGSIASDDATISNCYGFSYIPSDVSTRFYGAKSAGTLTHCYGREAADGVTACTDYSTLLTDLNNNRPNTTDYKAWVAATGRPPVFGN